jgi:membrane protease YdiL (CAAX protease family)
MALLVITNVVVNRVLDASALVVLVDVAAAAGLVAIARHAGVTLGGIGIDDASIARGWRFARWFVLGIVVVYALGVAIPTTRELFEDGRVRELGWAEVAWHALVVVPFGTVLLEEVAFRGVLPALLVDRRGPLRAYVLASLAFGLWHVLPAWEIHRVNPALRDLLHGTTGQVVGVAFGVGSTAVVGVFWCWLRYRTQSLVTTMVLHVATNSLAYLFSFVAWSLT